MSRPAPRTARATLSGLAASLVVGLVATLSLGGLTAPAHAANVATPGDFTGYGFDQCLGPSQEAMDRWLTHSPFLAVGIYISGDSRACRSQPNLTPAWVSTQLRNGWRLLPITLGPQASCQPRFPRYGNDETISPTPGDNGRYPTARSQGRAEAESAVAAARALGLVQGSTLWYDLEGFDSTITHCRESALAFLSAWTRKLHVLGYVSGAYSSASSGIAMLDNARVNRPGQFNLPDQIWIARWDGVANTSTSYIREDGWRNARVKQYRGGHDEVWGGVRINIDSNYLDVGRGSWAPAESHCNGVPIGLRNYTALRPATADRTPDPVQVKALQCLLTEKGLYAGQAQRPLQRGDAGGRPHLAGHPRLPRGRPLVAAELDVAAHQRPRVGAEGRLRRSRGTPPAAGPQRGQRHREPARRRRLRQRHDDRPPGLAAAGRCRGDRCRRRAVLGGPARGPALGLAASSRRPAARRPVSSCSPQRADPSLPAARKQPEVTGQRDFGSRR